MRIIIFKMNKLSITQIINWWKSDVTLDKYMIKFRLFMAGRAVTRYPKKYWEESPSFTGCDASEMEGFSAKTQLRRKVPQKLNRPAPLQ